MGVTPRACIAADRLIVMSSFNRFLAAHPDCAGTASPDGLRQREYGGLDAQQQVYTD